LKGIRAALLYIGLMGSINRQVLLEDTALNIQLGIYHLAKLLRYYKGDTVKALTAYNAGINGTAKGKGKGYARNVLTAYQKLQ
jgi:soluble lytic murein transglycosylase-like protein